MRRVLRLFVLSAVVFSCAMVLAQSLGDVAREARAKKADVQHAAHVYTDEDFSRRPALPEKASGQKSEVSSAASSPIVTERREAAAAMQAEIRRQKQKVFALETRIKEIEKRLEERNSIGPVTVVQKPALQINPIPGSCEISRASNYDPYKGWCEEPAKLEAELEARESELEKARAVLDEIQERARRMGFGSAFYDPD